MAAPVRRVMTAFADVWIGGVRVASAESMFTPGEVIIPAGVGAGKRVQVAVHFHSLSAILRSRRPRGRWRSSMVREQGLRWIRTTMLGMAPVFSGVSVPVGPWRGIRLLDRGIAAVVSAVKHASVDGTTGRVAVSARLTGLPASLEYVTVRVGEPLAAIGCIRRTGWISRGVRRRRSAGRAVVVAAHSWHPAHLSGDNGSGRSLRASRFSWLPDGGGRQIRWWIPFVCQRHPGVLPWFGVGADRPDLASRRRRHHSCLGTPGRGGTEHDSNPGDDGLRERPLLGGMRATGHSRVAGHDVGDARSARHRRILRTRCRRGHRVLAQSARKSRFGSLLRRQRDRTAADHAGLGRSTHPAHSFETAGVDLDGGTRTRVRDVVPLGASRGRAIGNACRKRGRSLLRGGCVSSSTGRRAQRASTFCDRIIGILDSNRRMP